MGLSKLKRIILDILFPPVCLNCGKYLEQNELLCEECASKIKFNSTLFCPVCKSRLPLAKKICHFDSPYLLAAMGNYNDQILRNLIHSLKYKSFTDVAPFLSNLAAEYLGDVLSHSDLKISDFTLMPIPLHPKREKIRGFNQAELLAEHLSQILNLPLTQGIRRIKNNPPQVSLRDYEERQKNISGCFEVKNPEAVSGKNIMLVDDVFTTGTTMDEAVSVLKNSGAKKIIALIFAKA